jgi:hypothetical protein
MSYYIFLKSLRSQEEFRKNPHVKIPAKSPCANFQSHSIFKNQILFRKEFFFVTSSPSGLSLILTAPHPLSPELFRTLLHPHDELKPPPLVVSGAPPLRHPSVAGEHLPSTASTGLSSPSIVGEHRRFPALARHTPVRRRRALCPRSTAPWTRSTEFSVENLIQKSVISGILQRSPLGFPKLTCSP